MQLRQDLSRGSSLRTVPATNASITFTAFAARWADNYVRANNKPSEQHTKDILLRTHLKPWFGDMRISQIRTEDVESYKAHKRASGLCAKTVNNHLAVLGKCLRTAVDWGLLQSTPRIKFLRTSQPSFDFLSSEESRRLLDDRMEPLWNLIVRIALRTGMRRGELCALDWSDVDLEHGLITVRRRFYRGVFDTPKSNRIRHIPMSSDLHASLSAVSGERQGLILHRPDSSPVAENPMTRALHRACKRSGVRPIGWHTLRHTFASQLVSESVPLLAVKDLLGHSTIAMTMRYAHLAPSTLRSAIDVLERAEVRCTTEKNGHQMGTYAELHSSQVQPEVV